MTRSAFAFRRKSTVEIASDSFHRANASGSGTTSALGTTDGQGTKDPLTWVVKLGNINTITSNKAVPSGPFAGVNITTVDPAAADIDAQVRVLTPAVGAINAGVVFRYTDTSNYLFAAQYANGDIQLWKRVTGTNTQLGSTATGFSAGSLIVLRVVAVGSSLMVYRNDTQVITASDSFNSTATICGMYGDDLHAGNGFQWSWFKVFVP